MGGALYNNPRMDKISYRQLIQDVDEKLSDLGIDKYIIPDGFRDTETYGDLDVCLPFPLLEDKKLKSVFGLTDGHIHHNSSVISINYQNKQIDFCHFEPENWISASCYMRNSDCGNMVGQMARYSTGYRLTHKGLMYPIRLKSEDQLGEILVSKDWKKILPFLDLDYEKWNNGFNDQLELFEWITHSRYFNADCFKFEALKHDDRTRNRKRKTYSAFVDWLAEQGDNLPNHYTAPTDKQEHLFRGLLHFQEEGYWIERAQPLVQERHYVEEARKVFNARNIMQITGLSGSALGQTRRDFFEYLESVVDRRRDLYNSVAQFISEHETNEIEEIFTNWYDENETN